MLLVSIHDVSSVTLEGVQGLRRALEQWHPGPVTLLVVPNYHHRAPLERSERVLSWLREQIARGDSVCLHGWYHIQSAAPRRWRARVEAALATANEAELLSAERDEIARIVEDGSRLLEEKLGVRPRGFVAPAWLEPPGMQDALRAAGYSWHEGSIWIEHLAPHAGDDRRVHTPVLGFATRSRLRELASLAWVSALSPALRAVVRYEADYPVRLALHPDDFRSAAVMELARRTLVDFARHTERVTYDVAVERMRPAHEAAQISS